MSVSKTGPDNPRDDLVGALQGLQIYVEQLAVEMRYPETDVVRRSNLRRELLDWMEVCQEMLEIPFRQDEPPPIP
jgi:hypothetical protein